jgi:uncharacterized protein DUF4824
VTWTRVHTLAIGVALIALTNAVALVGVWRNRSGEPESVLDLSAREIEIQRTGVDVEGENSGIALAIRTDTIPPDPSRESDVRFGYGIGAAEWLDAEKLAALGFDTSRSLKSPEDERYYRKLVARPALLVLEFDGSSYRRSLARAKQRADADPSEKYLLRSYEQERDTATRLFIVDAGLDAAALRANHPDRSRYAIVRGWVVPVLLCTDSGPDRRGDHSCRLSGAGRMANDAVNVPYDHRHVFEPFVPKDAPAPHYRVRLAFGSRFEPWVVGATESD